MNVEAILGKNLESIISLISRSDFSEEELKSFPKEFNIPISEAVLKVGQFEIFKIFSDQHQLHFLDEKVVKLNLLFSEEKIILIIDFMRTNYSDTFRFYTLQDFNNFDWKPISANENNFLEIKTKQIEFDKTKTFHLEKLESYQMISCKYNGFNFSVEPIKNFIYNDKKSYLVEIW